jgi:hypothetical protein
MAARRAWPAAGGGRLAQQTKASRRAIKPGQEASNLAPPLQPLKAESDARIAGVREEESRKRNSIKYKREEKKRIEAYGSYYRPNFLFGWQWKPYRVLFPTRMWWSFLVLKWKLLQTVGLGQRCTEWQRRLSHASVSCLDTTTT